MTHPVERVEDKIKVDAYQFMLFDDDGAANRPVGALTMEDLGSRLKEADVWFVATANMAIIKSSAADWHVVDVVLELWDGRPPVDQDDWIRDITTQMYCSSGSVRLVQTLGRPSRRALNLGAPAKTWAVRCSLGPGKGERYVEDGPPSGLETYRLQFWPDLP
jgi:hypothetical protein